jgi:RNA polymerase sigma-B factor
MRERWVKGRKLLYRGATDLEVAEQLEISVEEWIEVRKVCSGPPLELKEQAKPTDPLEPTEVDFGKLYIDMAKKVMDSMREEHGHTLDEVEIYLSGTGNRVPRKSIDSLLMAAGCYTTNWDEEEIKVLEGWEEISEGRLQGSLF